MAGRQHLGAELARGLQQVAELDRLIAVHARHRRFAGHVALGETVDHRFLEAALVVEDVMRNADPFGHRAGVMDVAAGAAGALAMGRGAVIVKLQRDADDVVSGVGQKRRGDRGIDAARHGDDDARRRWPPLDIERVQIHAHYYKRRPTAPPWSDRVGKTCRPSASPAAFGFRRASVTP